MWGGWWWAEDGREDEHLLGQGTGNGAAWWALIQLFARPANPSLPAQRFSLCQTLPASPFARVGQMGLSWTTPKGFLSSLAGTDLLESISPAEKSQKQPNDVELMSSL